MPRTVLVKDVVRDGIKLRVVAESGWEREWELRIENQRGVTTHWQELFESGEAAMEAGLRAIEEEGTAPFVNVDGFEYSFNDKP